MNQDNQVNYVAKAFLSCSLRQEDRPFIEFVEKILKAHKIQPFGTVGLYSASPINLAEHMKTNIPLADFVVIVATPRYAQKDLQTGKTSYGLSEMVHVETGMAYMANKPVVVFVQEGTNVGSFLPNVTEYILLNGKKEDLQRKWPLINSLISNAYNIVRQIKDKAATKSFWKALTTGLAIFGGIKFVESISDNNEGNTEQ